MVSKFAENGDFDSSGFIYFLYYWRKPLIIIVLLAVLGSILFSSPLFISPKYKSSVILFPVATNSISKALMSQQSGIKEDVMGFGEEEQAEQMLQLLSSNKIRERIVQKFNLLEHYGISEESEYKNTRLAREYDNNVSFRRTEYMAVKISVLDTDPQMAADIANTIAELLDSTKTQMQKERAMQAFGIVEQEYLSLQKEMSDIIDSLQVIGRLGVNDYESQSEVVNQQLAIALRANNMEAVKKLDEKLDILAEYGGAFLSLKNTLEYKTEQLTLLKTKYQEAKVDAESELPQKFIVNSAYKAEQKSYPIRWIIITVTTLSSLLLAILILIIIENFTKIKKKSLTFKLWPDKNDKAFTQEKGHKKKKKNKKKEKKIPVIENPVPAPVIEPEPTPEPQEKKNEEKEPEVSVKETEPEPVYINKASNDNAYNHAEMKKYYDNSGLVDILLKWWVHIAVIAIVALFLGILFSSSIFITPQFKSWAVVYPANIAPYSDESETEQMLQLLQSKDIKDSVIKQFDLARHYEIDSSFKYFYSTIYYEFGQNVSVSKTLYESVNITVFDKDPNMANDICNAIIHFYNAKVRRSHNEKYLEVIKMFDAVMITKQAHIDSLKHRLYVLSTEYGLLDYDAQANEVTKGYLRTVMGATSTSINQKEVMQLKKNIEEHGGDLIELVESIKNEAHNFSMLKVEYENAVRFYTDELTYTNVISPPFPSDKKAYPVRWMIVIFTMIATIFLAIIIILIIERYRPNFRLKK